MQAVTRVCAKRPLSSLHFVRAEILCLSTVRQHNMAAAGSIKHASIQASQRVPGAQKVQSCARFLDHFDSGG